MTEPRSSVPFFLSVVFINSRVGRIQLVTGKE